MVGEIISESWARSNRYTRARSSESADLFETVAIPHYRANFPVADEDGRVPIETRDYRVIVLSQSCDLELKKLPRVVVAAVFTLDEFEAINPDYKTKRKWAQVAQGRIEALHLLFGPDDEANARKCLVVSFREVAALPIDYLNRIAAGTGLRKRLKSPYLENLSQSFGRFFMRVALPQDLPRI